VSFAFLSFSGVRPRLTSATLFSTESDSYADDNELNIPPIVIFPAKNLERLTLRFMHSVSKSPSDSEPDLTAVLDKLAFPFSRTGRGNQGALTRLYRITIEMYDVLARCLRKAGIEKDKEMWERLDHVLSREAGYVPNVERLELKLLLRRGERMTDEEIRFTASSLLPSLLPTVRNIILHSCNVVD
jgi:hypothetical protein